MAVTGFGLDCLIYANLPFARGEAGLVHEGEEEERFRRDLEHLVDRLGFSE